MLTKQVNLKPLQVNTLQNGFIITHQEVYVRKLNGFPNLYSEMHNEPWADLKETSLIRNEYHTATNGKPDFQ